MRNTSATKSSNWSIRCGTKTHLLKRAIVPCSPLTSAPPSLLLLRACGSQAGEARNLLFLTAPKSNRPARTPAGRPRRVFRRELCPGLERQFKPELHQSRVVHRPRYSPELQWSSEVRTRPTSERRGGVKLRVVEQIEEFRPEVKPRILPRQSEPLDHRKIGVHKARP